VRPLDNYDNHGAFPFIYLLFSCNAVAADAEGSFNQTLELQGVKFYVTCPNNSSVNTVKIVPTGLTIDNATIDQDIDGTIVGAEVADLNADGSP
jgi:hypothetical protein